MIRIHPLIKSEKGSLSIEAILSLTLFLILVAVMAQCLNAVKIFDTVEHCMYSAADEVAVNEAYALLSRSGGAVEMSVRPGIFKGYLKENMDRNGLKYDDSGDIQNLSIQELSGFDAVTGAGNYKIAYEIPIGFGLPALKLTHEVRLKSIWQGEIESDQSATYVYTTTSGRKSKIYHTNPDCISLVRSWNTKGSIEVMVLEELEGFRECMHCVRERDEAQE